MGVRHQLRGLQPHATGVCLLLFDGLEEGTPFATIELDPRRHRTGDIWHIWVRGLGPGQAYAFRATGPYDPVQGHRFNPHKNCLRYWVAEMHVDGFRFDLASVLDRDERGNLVANPPLLESIADDPILHNVKLIADATSASTTKRTERKIGTG
jgi:pullulanase/glycogen debranching enzyme